MTRAEEILSLYDRITRKDSYNEAMVHRVVSFLHGHRVVRKTCGHGYKKVGNKCQYVGTLERMHVRKGHKISARKNKIHRGAIQRRRLRSLLRRSASGY